jgi:hypothetical protein
MNEQEQINKSQLVSSLLEHHRFYINRNWQFFAGILLVNSILLGSIDSLLKEPVQLVVVSFSSVLVIGTMYHLINWTNMQIDTNMVKVNNLIGEYKIEFPVSFFEGLINWMKFAIIILTLPYYFLVYSISIYIVVALVVSFLLLIFISEITTRRFLKRIREDKPLPNNKRKK